MYAIHLILVTFEALVMYEPPQFFCYKFSSGVGRQ